MDELKTNSDLSLKLFVVLSRAQRSIADIVTADMKTYGLNPSEFMVLELLFHKGDQPIQYIGRKVLLASGSMTYVVDKLETKGLIKRKSYPKDRRVSYASLTEAGKQLMNDIFPKHQRIIERVFGNLSAGEKQQLIALLKKAGYHAEELKQL